MQIFKIAVLVISVSLASCTVRHTPIANTDFEKIDFSQIRMFEKGKSCKRFFLGIIPLPFGQPSLINAVKDGKLRVVKVVDYESGFGFLVYKKCLIAYGIR